MGEPVNEGFIPRRAEAITVDIGGIVGLAVPEADRASLPVHVLDPIGTAVWACCDGSATIGQLVDEIAAAWQIDRAIVARDVVAFVQELRRLGLLEGGPRSD